MSSSYRLELDRWLAQLDLNARTVIDVGGAQLPVKGRTKSWDVKNYYIYDLATPHAEAPAPHIAFNLEASYERPPHRADVVFCLEVFDYLVFPHTALSNIWYLLEQGGVAYVTFPFVYPTHQPVEHEGLRYTENSIHRLADYALLEVVELIPRRPETDLLDQFYRAERMRAAKGYNHAVTGWIATLRRA